MGLTFQLLDHILNFETLILMLRKQKKKYEQKLKIKILIIKII